VRTLRIGKRRYINQFESDIMSDLEFDICKHQFGDITIEPGNNYNVYTDPKWSSPFN
jgi:hypothetical protein